MVLESLPLSFGKFHPPPIVVSGRILWAEFYPPRLGRRGLGSGDMGLKFDRVCPCLCYCINKAMRHSQATVMGLRYLANDHARHDRFILLINLESFDGADNERRGVDVTEDFSF